MPDLRQGCAIAKSTEETMPAGALVLLDVLVIGIARPLRCCSFSASR
jgi:hypothetical protein